MQQLFFFTLATRLRTPPKSTNPWRRRCGCDSERPIPNMICIAWLNFRGIYINCCSLVWKQTSLHML
jgi:hypothetical protein